MSGETKPEYRRRADWASLSARLRPARRHPFMSQLFIDQNVGVANHPAREWCVYLRPLLELVEVGIGPAHSADCKVVLDAVQRVRQWITQLLQVVADQPLEPHQLVFWKLVLPPADRSKTAFLQILVERGQRLLDRAHASLTNLAVVQIVPKKLANFR